ncbi:hypothetical protein E6H37_04875 [Candidatus Bathyarchaeota archaeon]|nr:MAG: hypothetical protein E6H37_04875 [Candidatus Bathyarchaeota archaeon]
MYSPAICAAGSGRLDVVIRGTNNVIFHSVYTGGRWSGVWDSPGGATLDQPACAEANGVLNVVVKGTDNGVWYNTMTLSSGAWTGWSLVDGGSTLSAPALTIDSAGTLHLVVRGTDNGGTWLNSKPVAGSWIGWTGTGGTKTIATPTVATQVPASSY